MTNEEAIEVLEGMLEGLEGGENIPELKLTIDTLDMAIKALEQKPSREIEDYENEIEDLHNRLDIVEYDKERYKEEITALETEIRALKNEQSEYVTYEEYSQMDKFIGEKPREGDLISRQAVIDGLARIAKAKARSDAQKALMGRSMYFVGKLPSAKTTINSTKTTITDGDLISRTDLLNAIWQKEYGKDYDGQNMLNIPHIDIIENMPSAEKIASEKLDDIIVRAEVQNIFDLLTRHTALLNDIKMMLPSAESVATWVELDDYPNEDWECDNCGFIITGIEEPYRFCPNCGKKMWK